MPSAAKAAAAIADTSSAPAGTKAVTAAEAVVPDARPRVPFATTWAPSPTAPGLCCMGCICSYSLLVSNSLHIHLSTAQQGLLERTGILAPIPLLASRWQLC